MPPLAFILSLVLSVAPASHPRGVSARVAFRALGRIAETGEAQETGEAKGDDEEEPPVVPLTPSHPPVWGRTLESQVGARAMNFEPFGKTQERVDSETPRFSPWKRLGGVRRIVDHMKVKPLTSLETKRQADAPRKEQEHRGAKRAKNSAGGASPGSAEGKRSPSPSLRSPPRLSGSPARRVASGWSGTK